MSELKNTVTLSNGNISYIINVNDSGYLETVYFGKTAMLGDCNCVREDVTHSVYFFVDGAERSFDDGFRPDCASLELSSHALFDKRQSAIVVQKPNGSYESDFRYVSHTVYDGIKPVEAQPHAFGKATTVEFLLKDTMSELYVTLYVSLFADVDVVVKSFRLENRGTETIRILRANSMQLQLSSCEYDLVHFSGRWGRERAYQKYPLHDGTQIVSSNLGRSSHEENPFVYLQHVGADNIHGEVIGFNLIYSSNFVFRADCTENFATQIIYGINDEDFEWYLENGKSFATPQAVISYSADGVDKMSQNFHKFIRENLITYHYPKPQKPILFNSWEGCYFNFDTQSIISYIDDAAKIGTELFVLDDGWFGERNDDHRALGDWFVNKKKIDLHKVMDHCHKKGIAFGIWFEPEMVNPDSELYRAHPDYALKSTNKNYKSLIRFQMHLDFSNSDVVDNIFEQMDAFLQEYPVDYIKWDYNRTVSEHYSELLGKKQGEVYHRLVLGYYSLLERITAKYPHIMIEGCSSGGGRFDMGTLYYTSQIWTSDESNPARRMIINYNTSIGYPLCTMGTHVNDSDIASYEEKAILALWGTYGYEMNPNLLTEDEIGQINKIAQIYKKYHAEVIENGTLYHILSPSESNLMCMQSVSKDKSASLVLLTNVRSELERFRFIKLRGLCGNKVYVNDYDNVSHTGDYLMNVGLNLSWEKISEFSFKLIVITEKE